MTHDEYVRDVASKLAAAHNSKDRAGVESVFRETDATLNRSDFTHARKREFWADVQRAFLSSRLLMEKQENSALHALMQAIREALKARQ